MELILRKAKAEDAAGVSEVMLVISDESCDMEKLPGMIEKIASDEDKYLLVAEEKATGKIVGSLLGVVFEDICGDGRPILLVENVAVLEDFQKNGVGQSMFAAIERWGREKRCHYEMLVSGLNRQYAHKFYKKNGFEEVKGFKKYF